MSTYYSFYLGKKNWKGKYEFMGPYLRGADKPVALLCRSRSFIDIEDFDAFDVPLNRVAEKDQDFVSTTYFGRDEKYSLLSAFPVSRLAKIASERNDGVVRGYIDRTSDLDRLAADNFYTESKWDYDVVSVYQMAEMPAEERAKYCSVAFTAYADPGYYASRLKFAVDEMTDYLNLEEGEELYIFVVMG